VISIEAVIEVEKLAKSYGKIQALKGVSFKVYSGEIVGYIGPNASGKTTTLKILAGLIKADFGEVKVLGLDPWENSLEVKSKLGFLPEKPIIPLGVEVSFLLEKVAKIRGISYPRREIIKLSQTLDFKEYLNVNIGKLSRGYLQRVLLATTLIGEPELLLLDEPTANLDPVGRKLLLSYLKELSRKKHTIIISSHILSEIEATCNKLIVIYSGSIIAKGKLEDLAIKYELPISLTLTGKDLEVKVNEIRKLEYIGRVLFDYKNKLIEAQIESSKLSEFQDFIKDLDLNILKIKPPSIEELYLKIMEDVEIE